MRVSIPLVFFAALAASVSAISAEAASAERSAPVIKVVTSGIVHSAFFGLSFDEGKGVAVGMGGAISESTDGGVSWKSETQAETDLALLSVARKGTHTIAVGQMGVVLVEEAPGKWKKADSGVPGRLLSVSVNSKGLAFIGGEFGTVLKSTDGGKTWAPSPPKWATYADANSFGTGEPHVYVTHVSENGEVTIAGEFGVILRSADGGATWKVLHPLKAESPTIFAMHVAEPGQGNSYAVGQNGEMLISPDGGKTWNKTPPLTESNYLGVAASKTGQVVITGMRVMMRSEDNGAHWKPVDEGDTLTDWYQAVRVESVSGRIFAVGHAGQIIQIGH